MTSALERLKAERERGCPTCGGILWSHDDELQDALLALWEACDEVHRHGGGLDPYGAIVKEIEALNVKANQVLGGD